jgi:hypothetical protein
MTRARLGTILLLALGMVFLGACFVDFGLGAGFSQGSPLPGAAFFLLPVLFLLGASFIGFALARLFR